MQVYRIVKQKYAADLTGKGAEIFGGRWNPVGVAALYTSESRALALLELLAHTPKDILPPAYTLLTLKIPVKLVKQIVVIEDLENDWHISDTKPPTQKIGQQLFLEKNVLGIKVPSVIIHKEWNVVLNPSNKNYNDIEIAEQNKFKFDVRLFK